MKYAKVFLVLIFLIVCIASLLACSATEQYFVFGTFLTVDLKTSSTNPSKETRRVKDYMDTLEKVLSPTVEGSDLYRINNSNVGEAVECHAETMEILSVAEYVFKMSDGAYDPSVYPLVRLWKFSGDTYNELDSSFSVEDIAIDIPVALAVVGLDTAFSIDYERRTVTKLLPGAMLDFGGIAKGYASDFAREIVSTKSMLINLGGNISAKGKSYSIGIANPSREDRSFGTSYYGTLTLKAGECISTSGDYERYHKVTVGSGTTYYHHIINPSTGYPANTSGANGIVSATVISSNGAFADAVATAVVVLGKEHGLEFLNKLKEDGRYAFDAILIDGNFASTVYGDTAFAVEV